MHAPFPLFALILMSATSVAADFRSGVFWTEDNRSRIEFYCHDLYDDAGKRDDTKIKCKSKSVLFTAEREHGKFDSDWLESDVQNMTSQQYEENADAIMDAIRAGNFIYDLSGAAR